MKMQKSFKKDGLWFYYPVPLKRTSEQVFLPDMPVYYMSLALTMLDRAVKSTLISVQGYFTLILTGGYIYCKWILNTRKIISGTYCLYKNIFNWFDRHAAVD